MNPLKEMIPSNKKGRRWYVLNKKGKGAVVGLMYESAFRIVFTERLYEAMIPQGVSDVRNTKTNREIRVVGGRNMVFESEGDLHSAAGKGLR